MTDMTDDDWDDPAGFDDGPDADCDHEDYDLDWGLGRATCNRCDHSWYLSDEQFRRHCEWAARATGFDDCPTLLERFRTWCWVTARPIRELFNRDCPNCRRPSLIWCRPVGDHSTCDEEIPF